MYWKVLFLSMISLTFLACTSQIDEMDENYDNFKKANGNYYKFEFVEHCFCPDAGQEVSITVSEAKVSAVLDDNYQPIEDIGGYKTIDELYAVLRDAIDRADSVEVEYDSDRYYPRSVKIDYDKASVDDEYAFDIKMGALVCSAVYVRGIYINVFDKKTNNSITCGSRADISDFNGAVESLDTSDIVDCNASSQLIGLGERAGLFDVEISKEGYQTQTVENFKIKKDSCHVITRTLDVYLEPTVE